MQPSSIDLRKNIEKMIQYSYPTSDNAKKAGLYNYGCYSVELVSITPKGQNPPNFIKGFLTLTEAQNYANTLPYQSNKFCLTVYGK
jgi:hypothetical protein